MTTIRPQLTYKFTVQTNKIGMLLVTPCRHSYSEIEKIPLKERPKE